VATGLEFGCRRSVTAFSAVDEMKVICSIWRRHETCQVGAGLAMGSDPADAGLLCSSKTHLDCVSGYRCAVDRHAQPVVKFLKISIVYYLTPVTYRIIPG
jgi:hypothetical protein